jgi:predicted nucleic acid-binding Zn ribbon protein
MKEHRHCDVCGKEIPGRSKRFCSRACQQSTYEGYRSSMMSDEYCRICGKELTIRQTQRGNYCSKSCAERARREREGSTLAGTMRNCVICGKEFEPTRREQACCSLACSKRKGGDTLSEKAPQHIYTCQHCGREYVAKAKERDTYCSNECRYAHRAASRPENAARRQAKQEAKRQARQDALHGVCSECGQEFEKKCASQRICSEECIKARNARKFREEKARLGRNAGRIRLLVCEECGAKFEHTIYNAIPKCCSERCSRKNWERQNPAAAASIRRRSAHKRRAMKYGNGPLDSIDPYIVYERDDWMCGICGLRVDPDLSCPHPHSASLDHIIPLSKGGTHTWDNVQLAHLLCNSRKRDIT